MENATLPDARDEALARVEVATLAAMLALTVAGNGSVLAALVVRRHWAGRKKLSRMYFFIVHLCVADLLNAFFNILPQLVWKVTYRFTGGGVLCKGVKFLQLLGPYLSSYVLVATALDRHHAICHPLTYCTWTSRRSRIMVWLAWATALAFCVPQGFIFSYQQVFPSKVFDCWATFKQPWGQKAYVTWFVVSSFVVPLCVLVATYWRICAVVWRHGGGNPLISRAKVNTVKQTVAVIALYVACSAPFSGAQLWAAWDPHAHRTPFFEGSVFSILTLLSSLNSCVNPWIYLAFNSELRRLLKKICVCAGRESDYRLNNSVGSGSSNNGPQRTSGSDSAAGHRRWVVRACSTKYTDVSSSRL